MEQSPLAGALESLLDALQLMRGRDRLGIYKYDSPSPPAAPEKIREFEARCGPIPREYQEFLTLHNGWPSFFQNGALYSIEEMSQNTVLERHRKELRDEGVLPEWTEACLWIGGNLETNDFYLLDSEGQVTWIAYGDVIESFASFHDFISYVAEEIQFEATEEMS